MTVPVSPSHVSGPLRPIWATAWVGLGSVTSLAIGVIVMKAYALLVGPEGVGLIGLMQAMVNLAVIIAGLGVSTSAVGAISEAVAMGGPARLEGLRRAALLAPVVAGIVVAALMVLFREPLAIAVLGSASRASDVGVLAIAVVCSAAAFANVAVLTGKREVIQVSMVTAGTAVAAAIAGISLVGSNGLDGLAPAVVVGAGVHVAFAWWVQRRSRAPVMSVADAPRVRDAAGELVKVGLPIAASQLAGMGALLATPVIVLQLLGPTEVGFYRAAAAISIGYLTVFVATLTQEYLPRIANAGAQGELAEMVERQMRLTLGVSVPAILSLLAAGPFIVAILYSSEFAPAFDVLKWQLVGDLVRVPAWILAFVLLAQGRSKAYFAAELTAGTALLMATWVGVGLFRLPGAGVAYALAQVAYYGAVWILVGRSLATSPGPLQFATLATAVLAAVVLTIGPAEPIGSGLFAAAAAVMAALSWPRMYRMYRAGHL